MERQKVDGRKYVVWIKGRDGWRPGKAVDRDRAEALVQRLSGGPWSYRMVPAPRTTVEDLAE
ncbi:hypothetical protein SAMN05421543_106129 [Alicyclobacillus macrosporangiidus]|uniref:Uncharacterized protein n=1 Tax=Alicyclobacillus macrosporangiidus TaxID=392015 RepID=A0A1I7ICJ1_9BACL|nr:hypothetical protein SAMN05421543_106129 [Alicyclobacillus macrosporangiidus]